MQGTAFTKAQMQATAHCVAQEHMKGVTHREKKSEEAMDLQITEEFFSQCPRTWGLTCTL